MSNTGILVFILTLFGFFVNHFFNLFYVIVIKYYIIYKKLDTEEKIWYSKVSTYRRDICLG